MNNIEIKNMKNINLASQKYWDSGYENFNFIAMSKNYPTCKLLYKNFKPTINKNVFEIGVFPGRLIYHFGKLGYELNGNDQTLYLKNMQDWLTKEHFLIGEFKTEDILELKTNKKYDIVFSSGFIEHFDNFEEIIKIHTNLTNAGGHVFITVPNFSGSIQKFLHSKLDKENISRHNLLAMDVEKWKTVLINEGFDIIESGYFGGFDFWVDNEKRGLFKKIITKILTNITPLRFLPNCQLYSPEIVIIAKKK